MRVFLFLLFLPFSSYGLFVLFCFSPAFCEGRCVVQNGTNVDFVIVMLSIFLTDVLHVYTNL